MSQQTTITEQLTGWKLYAYALIRLLWLLWPLLKAIYAAYKDGRLDQPEWPQISAHLFAIYYKSKVKTLTKQHVLNAYKQVGIPLE